MSAARPEIPNYSALHVKKIDTGRLKAASVSSVLTSKNLDTCVQGVPFAPTVALVPGVTGRNLQVVITDANDSSSTAWQIDGEDQFHNAVSERFPASGSQAGHGTILGTKVFTKITQITPLNAAGAAADSVTVGHADIVGIPEMLSIDGHELKDAQLVIAANTTLTKKTINSTNFDFTYFACKAALFAASAVVDGDIVEIAYKGDQFTPDDGNVNPTK